jgi:DNA polymerase-1
MNHYITEDEAKRIIQTYFEVFPGIRRRQENIRKAIQTRRMLKTPIGRERHFYGRMDDSTFREAYSYCPQSVIPDITNHLMLKLWDEKDYLDCEFLLQVHDSLLLQAPPERVEEIAALAKDLSAWHPEIQLAGGKLLIPVEVEVGDRWGKMETI